MRTILAAAALVIAAAAGLGGEPPKVESDWEHVRGLVRLRWFDTAERAVEKMTDKNEAALARAVLALERAEAEPDAMKRVRLGEEARKRLDEFRKSAPADHRLIPEAAALDAAVARSLERSCQAALRGRLSPEDRESLGALLADLRAKRDQELVKAVDAAEVVYKASLAAGGAAKVKAFESYANAALERLDALIHGAEVLEPGSEEQRKAGRALAEAAVAWTAKQAGYDPEMLESHLGVRMSADYAAGFGFCLAGETAKACTELDKVIAVDLAVVEAPPQAMKRLAALRGQAVCVKARALSGAAEKSGKPEDWRKALGVLEPAVLSAEDSSVRVRARVLKARCLAKLGEPDRAIEELTRTLQDIDRDDERRPPLGAR